jgi:hypothetical protein
MEYRTKNLGLNSRKNSNLQANVENKEKIERNTN